MNQSRDDNPDQQPRHQVAGRMDDIGHVMSPLIAGALIRSSVRAARTPGPGSPDTTLRTLLVSRTGACPEDHRYSFCWAWALRSHTARATGELPVSTLASPPSAYP